MRLGEWEILENYTYSSNLTTSIMPLNYFSKCALLHALMGYFFLIFLEMMYFYSRMKETPQPEKTKDRERKRKTEREIEGGREREQPSLVLSEGK